MSGLAMLVYLFLYAPLLMLVTALAASAVPGWIAARTQPMTALRDQ